MDAVVWEEVEARTQEEATLSATFLVFMVVATALAAIGIIRRSPVDKSAAPAR